MKPLFGDIGVRLEGYTAESVYELLEDHGLEDLFDDRALRDTKPFNQNTYLQSADKGLFKEGATVTVLSYFMAYITDMENFLLILRTGILDQDTANSLVEELYLQGLIKPRNKPWLLNLEV